MLATNSDMNGYDFTLTTTTGESASLTAKRKTIVYFFAPWCSVCHASIENLQAIYQKNGEIDVIAIGLDYLNTEEIDDFVASHQLTFPVAYGSEAVKKAYKVYGYPSYYILDQNNVITAKSIGYSSEIGLYLNSL